MSDYHDKLVIIQNVSLALKIAEILGDQAKTEAHEKLIDRLSENVNLYLTQKDSSE
jgi:ethanolamine utilization cobalamin adenosyltransferase